MQQQSLGRPSLSLQVKPSSLRETVCRIRTLLLNTCGRYQNVNAKIATSPLIDQTDQWYHSIYSSPLQALRSSNSSIITASTVIMDGSTERVFGGRGSKSHGPVNVSAIFVHAGAGYHSTTNEHIHLGACNEYVVSAVSTQLWAFY